MHGVHKRVGEERKPDEIITIDVLHAVDTILESEWGRVKTEAEKRRIGEVGAWMMGGFCTGLRGEKMLLVDMLGTAKCIQRLMRDDAFGLPDRYISYNILHVQKLKDVTSVFSCKTATN